jgi:hypothetical protein
MPHALGLALEIFLGYVAFSCICTWLLLLRLSRGRGLSRHIEPEALVRVMDWSNEAKGAGAAAALLTLREGGRGGSGSDEAQAAGRYDKSALARRSSRGTAA